MKPDTSGQDAKKLKPETLDLEAKEFKASEVIPGMVMLLLLAACCAGHLAYRDLDFRIGKGSTGNTATVKR